MQGVAIHVFTQDGRLRVGLEDWGSGHWLMAPAPWKGKYLSFPKLLSNCPLSDVPPTSFFISLESKSLAVGLRFSIFTLDIQSSPPILIVRWFRLAREYEQKFDPVSMRIPRKM